MTSRKTHARAHTVVSGGGGQSRVRVCPQHTKGRHRQENTHTHAHARAHTHAPWREGEAVRVVYEFILMTARPVR